jgi:DnaJ-class molecular chaperone
MTNARRQRYLQQENYSLGVLAKRRTKKKRTKKCHTCWGEGNVTNRLGKLVKCPICEGTGKVQA